MLRKKMIACLGQDVARRWTSGPAALRWARHARLDPAFTLELEQLLPNSLARELELVGELRDR
jgi:hypothetical protein